MLLSAEELLLFLLDEENGTFLPLTERTEDLVLAGAVLMDLQLANRIDTDLDELTLSNPTPVGEDVLDPTLAAIAASETTHGALYWVEETARQGRRIRERTIDRLIARGILLEPGDDGFLSLSPEVAHARRYPATEGVAQEHIRLRVMRVLFSDEIPDPADIVIISLLDACDVWRKLLTPEELMKARRRIETVSRLDLIGRAVATLVRMVRPTVRADRRRAVGLPLARGLPLIGSTLAVASDPRAFFVQEYLRSGPVFRVRTVGRDFVAIAGQDANLFVSRAERMHLHTSDMWDPLCAEFGASRFVLNMDGKDHVRMRRETREGVARQLIESQIPKVVEVIRRRVAEMPVHTPLAGLPPILRLAGETTSAIVAGASTGEYVADVRLVLIHAQRFQHDSVQDVELAHLRRVRRPGGEEGVGLGLRALPQCGVLQHGVEHRRGNAADGLDACEQRQQGRQRQVAFGQERRVRRARRPANRWGSSLPPMRWKWWSRSPTLMRRSSRGCGTCGRDMPISGSRLASSPTTAARATRGRAMSIGWEAALDEQTRTLDVILRVPKPFAGGVRVQGDLHQGARSVDRADEVGRPPLPVGKFVDVRIDGLAPGPYCKVSLALPHVVKPNHTTGSDGQTPPSAGVPRGAQRAPAEPHSHTHLVGASSPAWAAYLATGWRCRRARGGTGSTRRTASVTTSRRTITRPRRYRLASAK